MMITNITEGETVAGLDDLPDTLMLDIFSRCSQNDLLQVQLVSKRWQNLAKDRYLWKYCDFSSQSVMFLRHIAKSSFLKNTNAIKIVKTLLPIEFLKIVLRGENLKAVSLKQCHLKTMQSEDIMDTRQEYVAVMSRLKLLDLRQCGGDTQVLLDYLLFEGYEIEALGLPTRIPPIIQRKVATCMKYLRILDCSESSWVCDVWMLHVAQSCPHLVHLSVRRCPGVFGYNLTHLFTNCRGLKSLNLQQTRLTDGAVMQQDWSKVDLEELDLSQCYGIDEPGLICIMSKQRYLRYLRTPLTDAVVDCMLAQVSRLEVFELRRRYPTRVELISCLLYGCSNLVVLDTSLIPIHAKHFRGFLPKMPKLRTIVFAAHEMMGTCDLLRQIAISCKNIEMVGVNCYHSYEDRRLQEGLIELALQCKRLKVISMQGFFGQIIIDNLKSLARRNELLRNVEFQFPKQIEMPEMKHGLSNAFKKYEVVYR